MQAGYTDALTVAVRVSYVSALMRDQGCKAPLPHDLQAGREVTEAVTRLWKPSVWRAPHRRPQVKARN